MSLFEKVVCSLGHHAPERDARGQRSEVRIVSKKPLVDFYDRNPDAREGFEKWYESALGANWGSYADVNAMIPQTDLVRSRRGTFLVFDVRGNRSRIVCAVHFNTRILFVRYAGDHAGCDHLDFDAL